VAEIYDFLSRKSQFDLVKHNFKQNDEFVEQHGKYIGVLTKQRTESLRKTIDMMEFKKNQIEKMMTEYEVLQLGYNEMVTDGVSFLGVRNNGVEYDPEVWEFYVDVKGHCWVVKNILNE
jgi:hypothetical protein